MVCQPSLPPVTHLILYIYLHPYVVNVTLTDKGREALSLATPAGMEIADQVMLSVSKGDAVQLEKLLNVLR